MLQKDIIAGGCSHCSDLPAAAMRMDDMAGLTLLCLSGCQVAVTCCRWSRRRGCLTAMQATAPPATSPSSERMNFSKAAARPAETTLICYCVSIAAQSENRASITPLYDLLYMQALCEEPTPLPALRQHLLWRLLRGAGAAAAQVPVSRARPRLLHLRRAAGAAAALPRRWLVPVTFVSSSVVTPGQISMLMARSRQMPLGFGGGSAMPARCCMLYIQTATEQS